ncbi:MAG: hypothetical protein ACRCUY_14150 [Thermoguttaceae bacterium]
MKHFVLPLLFTLILLALGGCQSLLLTALVLVKGTDVKPKYDILLKGEKRVAVACRSMASNSYDVQNAPREIARQVSGMLNQNVQNKKLEVIDQNKVETWLDDCNNDFDSFVDIGRNKNIKADIIIGIDMIGFQIRDPNSPYMIQGRCQVQVKAFDCKTGEVLASEIVMVVDPPNSPIHGGPGTEAAFRPQFLHVIAQQIAILFHHHDPNKTRRIDSDSLGLQAYQ